MNMCDLIVLVELLTDRITMTDETNGSESDLTVHGTKETPPATPSTIVASLDKSILQVFIPLSFFCLNVNLVPSRFIV